MSAAVPKLDAGAEISLRIGQRVRHRDHDGKRVTGVVRGMAIDSDRTLQVDIVLDAPIVIPACGIGDRAINLWNQHVPAHELVPFDDRDEVIAELAEALRDMVSDHADLSPATLAFARRVLARVEGVST